MPAIGNRPPLADAGEDDVTDTLEAVTLVGSGEDGESPSAPASADLHVDPRQRSRHRHAGDSQRADDHGVVLGRR